MPVAIKQPLPTAQQMLLWASQLQGEWGGKEGSGSFTQAVEEEKQVYFQQFDLVGPGGGFGIKSGSAPSDADAAIDSLVPDDILISVKPARARERYRQQATKLSLFGRGVIAAWRKKRDVIRLLASDIVIRRVGVSRVLFDDTLWPAMPKDLEDVPDDDAEVSAAQWAKSKIRWAVKNRKKFPVVFERRDPRFVRWRESDAGDLLVVVEEYETPALEAQVAFGHFPEATRIIGDVLKGPNLTLHVKDVWYGAYRAIFINEQPIFPIGKGESRGVAPHGYAEIPYVIVPFRELPFENANERYRGMLSNAKELYQAESLVLTMTIELLKWNAWRTWIYWKNGQHDPLEVTPGTAIPINEQAGEYIKMLEGTSVPPEVFNVIQTVDSYIQRNGVAQGPRTAEGTRSAQQLWGIQALRQLKIDSPKDNLQRGLQKALALAARIVEEMIEEPVILPVPGKDREGNDYGEVVVRPDDIDGYWEGFEVAFSRRLDPALIEQAKALQALATNNWMPMVESWRLSGLCDDPQLWEDLLLLQSTDRLPVVLELSALERIRSWYGEDDEKYVAVKEAVLEGIRKRQGGGGPAQPPEGAPGMPAGGQTGPSPMGMPSQPAGSAATANGAGSGGAPQGGGRPSGNPGRMPPPRSVGP